ncbi:DUF6586 family protein [Marinomonas ostreistagni]|uniref:DUF6586 family protein n=1 Tax=Marinomonas ostreistagni TaxID=359209 RepID=UPI00194EA721|nr:DUF6586 family protein [Marinomonas ostreistagni]MBM6550183.1 hypothetical protein [Marinomonas ostreistagni]
MIATSAASITNQRLDAARRLLAQGEQPEFDWMYASFETSALFQLRSALNGLLQELKSAYGLNAGLSVAELMSSSSDKGVVVPALQELHALEGAKDSWLNQLYSGFQSALECQPKQSTTFTDASSLIGKGTDDAASTKFILNSLVELVLRSREDAAEY